MTMWVTVGFVYAVLLAGGIALGHYFASRSHGRGGGLTPPPATTPPAPPTFGAEWQPLGSDFDRALLPGVSFVEDLQSV